MPQQNNTFWYETPRDMLAKLDREITSLSNIDPLDNHRKADTVLNAAITAWQMADWVRTTMTAEQRDRLANSCGMESDKINASFLDEFFRSNGNVHICRQLATAGKHVQVTRHHDPYIQTKASLFFDATTGQSALNWMISVDHRDTHVTVREVLEGAHQYWQWLLDLLDGK